MVCRHNVDRQNVEPIKCRIDKISNRQTVEQTKCRQTKCMLPHAMENTEETIAKYAVDANPFRLGSTKPNKKYPVLGLFFGGGPHRKTAKFFFCSTFFSI